MPITSFTVEKVAAKSWTYAWAGAAPFDVYEDGEKVLSQTSLTVLTVEGDDEFEPPSLEVRDNNDSGLAESVQYSPFLTFQWRGSSEAEYYKIQEFVDSAWTDRKIQVESGRGYYRETTAEQADVTTHSWRIIAIDDEGNESQPLAFEAFMVRNPAPPVIDITYDSGTGLVTVAAR